MMDALWFHNFRCAPAATLVPMWHRERHHAIITDSVFMVVAQVDEVFACKAVGPYIEAQIRAKAVEFFARTVEPARRISLDSLRAFCIEHGRPDAPCELCCGVKQVCAGCCGTGFRDPRNEEPCDHDDPPMLCPDCEGDGVQRGPVQGVIFRALIDIHRLARVLAKLPDAEADLWLLPQPGKHTKNRSALVLMGEDWLLAQMNIDRTPKTDTPEWKLEAPEVHP